MGAKRLLNVLAIAVALFWGASSLVGPSVHASAVTASAQRTYDTAEECIQDQTALEMSGCTSHGEGWVKMERGVPGSSAFGGFLTFVFLWAAIPTIASGMVASSRQQSVGIAVLLGLILGWIGLLIVVLAMKPEVTTAARTFIEREAAPRSPVSPGSQRRSSVDRLAELMELKEKGLVTAEEYEARRAAIIHDV